MRKMRERGEKGEREKEKAFNYCFLLLPPAFCLLPSAFCLLTKLSTKV
jgi:hypothetical protein